MATAVSLDPLIPIYNASHKYSHPWTLPYHIIHTVLQPEIKMDFNL